MTAVKFIGANMSDYFISMEKKSAKCVSIMALGTVLFPKTDRTCHYATVLTYRHGLCNVCPNPGLVLRTYFMR